jgi:hypothetical protein
MRSGRCRKVARSKSPMVIAGKPTFSRASNRTRFHPAARTVVFA